MLKKCLFCFFTIKFLNACSDGPTETIEDKPGRRDYVWTVDTLNYPYAQMYRMWGRNSKDLFLLMLDGLVHYNGMTRNICLNSINQELGFLERHYLKMTHFFLYMKDRRI
jgi:hypothetical protein